MRLLTFLLSLLFIAGCAGHKNPDIFARYIDSTVKEGRVDPATKNGDIYFSPELWNYIATHFESASVELFGISGSAYPQLMSDTSYDFALITVYNRPNLLRYLPKDLSIQESLNYREEKTMRQPKDDTAFKVDSIVRKWEKASPEIEKEYLKFYAMVTDAVHDYILIMRKSYRQGILDKLQGPR